MNTAVTLWHNCGNIYIVLAFVEVKWCMVNNMFCNADVGIWPLCNDVPSFPSFRRAPVNRRRVGHSHCTSTLCLRHRRKWRHRLWRHLRTVLRRRQRRVLGRVAHAQSSAAHMRSAVPQLRHIARQNQGFRVQFRRRTSSLNDIAYVRFITRKSSR